MQCFGGIETSKKRTLALLDLLSVTIQLQTGSEATDYIRKSI